MLKNLHQQKISWGI